MNMFNWVKRQLDRIGSPVLDWIQIEVTTHCNGSCSYCPHGLTRKRWVNKHMPMDLFREVVPFLRHTDLVYLQGWGEPLLNEDLLEMVRICKDQGKRVGFTTNGTLLTESMIRTLIGLRLDIIGISLAGTTAKTHNRIREGTDFNEVISRLEVLHRIQAEKNTRDPEVHLAYLLVRSNFEEVKDILALAERVGAKQVVASNLTLIVDPGLSSEAIFNDTERMDYYRGTLEEIAEKGARKNILFDYPGPGLDEASMCCRENVHRACVINVEGEVVPCVFTNPLLSSQHIFKDQSLPLRGMSFGNIRNESLGRIWRKKEYVRFRALSDPMMAREPREIRSKMPACCMECYKRLEASRPCPEPILFH